LSPGTVGAAVTDARAQRGDRPLLLFGDDTFTYADVEDCLGARNTITTSGAASSSCDQDARRAATGVRRARRVRCETKAAKSGRWFGTRWGVFGGRRRMDSGHGAVFVDEAAELGVFR
jgi:hypothetical protein